MLLKEYGKDVYQSNALNQYKVKVINGKISIMK